MALVAAEMVVKTVGFTTTFCAAEIRDEIDGSCAAGPE